LSIFSTHAIAVDVAALSLPLLIHVLLFDLGQSTLSIFSTHGIQVDIAAPSLPLLINVLPLEVEEAEAEGTGSESQTSSSTNCKRECSKLGESAGRYLLGYCNGGGPLELFWVALRAHLPQHGFQQ